jgi:hypothetical protein
MKGIVFNLLEHVAVRTYGDEAWDDVLAAAGVDGAYTSLGSYPDEHLFKLVGAASEALDTPPDEVIRWFGRSALPMLADAYPAFFAPHRNTRDFLLTLNDIIHPEVRKLYPGADVPDFDMIATDDGNLTMVYRSERKLCAFAVGLIEGAANHFDERVSVHQPLCMNRGDENCDLEISFN